MKERKRIRRVFTLTLAFLCALLPASDSMTLVSQAALTQSVSGTFGEEDELTRSCGTDDAGGAAALMISGEESDDESGSGNSHTHSYTAVVTEPTCTKGGYTTYTCSCGDTYIDDVTEATGHSYSGNICSVCGALKTTSVSSAAITLSKTSYSYSGKARTPSVAVKLNGTTLMNGTDYTVSYSNNINAGTATVTVRGTGSYSGTAQATFTIEGTSLSSASVTLSKTSYTFSGSARKPSVTVKITVNGKKKTLTKGTDYTVSYSNNISAGTATVTVRGTGGYTGSIKKTFKITKKSISSGSVSLSRRTYTYSGSARRPTATVKVKIGSKEKTLSSGTDYTVSYENNKSIGTATVTITGKGNYKGTLKTTFTIKPKQVTIKSVTSKTENRIKVKWEKLSGGVRYQIYYRVKGTSSWSKKTVSSSTVSKTLSSLNGGKTYQIKIRAYKEVSGTIYYGSWSSVKKIKCKAESKVVYLTFDDGPSDNMGKILDILDKYDVKATFFVTGNNSKYRYNITRAYEEGHAIGLHSYTHNYSSIYKSKSAFFNDLKKISNLVYNLTGERTCLMRFPGGSSNTVSRHYCTGIMTTLTKAVEEEGYTYFDWNCDSTDASGNNVAVSKIVSNATSCSAKKINILMHSTDAKDTTVTALPKIIEYYRNKGYTFEVLTESSYTAHHGVNN